MYFIHTSVIPEFLESLWATKNVHYTQAQGVRKQQNTECPLPFPDFASWNLFSPYDPWSMQSKKGLSIYILLHSLAGDSVACTCFKIPALDTEKWEGNYLIKLFSLPLVNSIWQLWEIVFKRAHYCAVWISEIKVKPSYFLTAYFPSGCPIITSASVTGSGSSHVISTLWKSLMPFWLIYFLIYSFSCSTVLGGALAVLNQGMPECFAAWTVLLCIQQGEFFEQGHRGCCCYCDYWNYLTSFVLFLWLQIVLWWVSLGNG